MKKNKIQFSGNKVRNVKLFKLKMPLSFQSIQQVP